MEWIFVCDRLPASGRVLAYSPSYVGKDDSMAFRIIDYQFVKLDSEITAWCNLIPPTTTGE